MVSFVAVIRESCDVWRGNILCVGMNSDLHSRTRKPNPMGLLSLNATQTFHPSGEPNTIVTRSDCLQKDICITAPMDDVSGYFIES